MDLDAVKEGSFEGDLLTTVGVVVNKTSSGIFSEILSDAIDGFAKAAADVAVECAGADDAAVTDAAEVTASAVVCLELSLTILDEEGGRIKAVLAEDEGTSSSGKY